MSNMNSALSAWQLVMMAVIPVAALAGWIITVFIVAREPRRPKIAAAAPAAPAAVAVSGTAEPVTAGESEPERKVREPVAA